MELTTVERAAQTAAAARDAGLSRERRRREGIVHTAPELARFAARAADDLLRAELGEAAGLASARVSLIDPACGPGAFLAGALSVAKGRGSVPRAVLGLDRDATALATASRALGPELDAAGWPCDFDARDTLVDVDPGAIAARAPIAVVLGNPPWIGSAQAPSAPALDRLLDDFRCDVDGAPLRERKIGVLADAYVRFVRVACEIARQACDGAVVALVTNASFLDGPVHRGMRAALRRYFDGLYVLDLGGNALVARARGVGRDDNVFGVRPAVCVVIGWRRGGACDRAALAPVRYLRVAGTLEQKIERIARLRIVDAEFKPLAIAGAQQRFVPSSAPRGDYERWPSLAEAMPIHQEGVQTNRDAAAIDDDRERLLRRLRAFVAGERRPELEQLWTALPHYRPEAARAAIAAAFERDPDGTRGELLQRIAYRPFDTRWFAAIAPLCHRPRPRLLAAMARSEFALVTVRKDRGSVPWAHFGASRHVVDNCYLSSRSSCRARAFPTHDPEGRENLSAVVAAMFAERIGQAITSSDFASYTLAVLASPRYRAEHDEALRIDYPRIPLPADAPSFDRAVRIGRRLVELFCAPVGGAQRDVRVSEIAALVASIDGEIG